MTKICKNIELIHSDYVLEISGSDITPMVGKTIQTMKPFSTRLTESKQTENGNFIWKQIIEVTTLDMLEDYIYEYIYPHMILRLRFDDGSITVVGDKDNPCQVESHEKDEFYYTLTFSHTSESPLF